eukprot:TRINITY_DN1339_c1_g1_i1.p1 TRINITY_DN1339_c1_g1~~TRINITY_DN1339_c1_g1_i1.p1  ORF type:complete len:869 (-),score=160.50 TRINITY_DN1339_c1_g1_i1:18-2624(-)
MGEVCSSHEKHADPKDIIAHSVAALPIEDEQASTVQVLESGTKVEFLTDVEGNWDYFLLYVSRSEVLQWLPPHRGVWGPGKLAFKNDSCMVVFGGDAVDKGPGDIRFVKALLELKEEYPQRVHIILGNRDINKLRFYTELADGEDGSRYHPTWEPNSKTYLDYVKEKKLERGSLSTLRWMLDCNMGCQNTTFETRAQELALLRSDVAVNPITAQDVLNSFRGSVDPAGEDPWMLELMKVGQLAILLGDTLFVHGGIPDGALRVPSDPDVEYSNVSEWVQALNLWKYRELQAFISQPAWYLDAQGVRQRNADSLLLYGTPGFTGKTVIYHNPLSNGNAMQMSQKVEDFLHASGVRVVFSGHQPHGQTPSVVRHHRTGLLALSCDTSYSCMKSPKFANPADMRGNVVSVVCKQGSVVSVQSAVQDGGERCFELDTNIEKCKLPDVLVGLQLRDESWVKSVAKDRKTVFSVLGKGRNLRIVEMHPGQACMLLKGEYLHLSKEFELHLSELVQNWIKDRMRGNEQAPTDIHFHSTLAPDDLHHRPFNRKEFDEASCVLFTIDDFRYLDEGLQKKTVASVNRLIDAGKRVIFYVSDSTFSTAGLRAMLEKSGFKLEKGDARQLVTSSRIAAYYAKHFGSKKALLLNSGAGLIEEFRNAGIQIVACQGDNGECCKEFMPRSTKEHVMALVQKYGDCDTVVVGDDNMLTSLKVCLVAALVQWRGKEHPVKLLTCSAELDVYIGTISLRDTKVEAFQGRKVRSLGAGTISHTITDACNVGVDAINIGMPGAFLAEVLRLPKHRDGFEVDFDSTVLVCTQLEAVGFAHLCGMKSLLLLSGATTQEELDHLYSCLEGRLEDTNLAHVPTWVLESAAEL